MADTSVNTTVGTTARIKATIIRTFYRAASSVSADYSRELLKQRTRVSHIFDRILDRIIPRIPVSGERRVITPGEKRIHDLVKEMQYEFELEINSYTDHKQRTEIAKCLEKRTNNLEKFLNAFFANKIAAEAEAISDSSYKEKAINDFYDDIKGHARFYATKMGRMLVKLAAFVAMIYLGAEIAETYFPQVGDFVKNMVSPESNLAKYSQTEVARMAGGALLGAGSAAAYKWGHKVPYFRSFINFLDYSIFNAATSHEQMIAEEAMRELDRSDPAEGTWEGVKRFMR